MTIFERGLTGPTKLVPVGPTEARIREARGKREGRSEVLNLLGLMDFDDAVDAILGHLEGRGDVDGEALERASDRLRRVAWDVQRRGR